MTACARFRCSRTASRCGGRRPIATRSSPRSICGRRTDLRCSSSCFPRFDVLIENFRPGTLDRWGLSRRYCGRSSRASDLRAPPSGRTGPIASGPALRASSRPWAGSPTSPARRRRADPSGVADRGFDRRPVRRRRRARRRCGSGRATPMRRGEEIDLALTEAAFRLLDVLAIEHVQLGTVRGRIGNANGYSAPAAVFRTSRRSLGDAGGVDQRAVCRELPGDRTARPDRRPALCQQRPARPARRRAQRHLRRLVCRNPSKWSSRDSTPRGARSLRSVRSTRSPTTRKVEAREVITRVPRPGFRHGCDGQRRPALHRDPSGAARRRRGRPGSEVDCDRLGLSRPEMKGLPSER